MIIRLAWRNVWRNKARSLIIMLSVGLGLFAGIAVNALYEGMMQRRLNDLIHRESGHIQLHHPAFKADYDPRYYLPDPDLVLSHLEHDSAVLFIARRSVTMAMIASTAGSSGVLVNGIIPEFENMVTGLKDKIVDGRGLTTGFRNEIIIGSKLAEKMRLHTGSKVVLTFTDTSSSLVSGAFRVKGIYRSVNSVFDERNVYVQKSQLDDYLGTLGQCHEIAVILKQDEMTEPMKKSLSIKFPDISIATWAELSPETKLMNDTVDVYALIIMGIIMAALSFGILNTMLMALLERSSEIGMMEALGMSRLRIFILVVLETLFLTLTGIPVALFISYGVIEYYHKKGLDLSGMGSEMMNSFGFSTMIHPEFPFDKITSILAIVFATAVLSALFPALRLMKLNPVKALSRFR